MRITIEIPREFEQHFMNDRFENSLKRVSVDMHNEMSCGVGISGTYEIELVDMLTETFKNAEFGESTQAKKEATEALNKLEDKLDQAYSDAVNDAQGYWNPRVAQDAL